MRHFLKIGILVGILLFFKVGYVTASNFKAIESDFISVCQQDDFLKDNASSIAQSISSIKITAPRTIEYNFNLHRIKIKNTYYSKLFFHFNDACKVLQSAHLEKGDIYKIVYYVRHSSKYYIYALRHILI